MIVSQSLACCEAAKGLRGSASVWLPGQFSAAAAVAFVVVVVAAAVAVAVAFGSNLLKALYEIRPFAWLTAPFGSSIPY